MPLNLVLDADWFVIEQKKFIKQLAFSSPSLGVSGLFTFSLPPNAREHKRTLYQQARHSHGLVWHTRGSYQYNQVGSAFEEIFRRLRKRPSQLIFYAKGLEKCKLLEKFVPEVKNLEDYGCPPYKDISSLEQSTINKAVAFGLWLG